MSPPPGPVMPGSALATALAEDPDGTWLAYFDRCAEALGGQAGVARALGVQDGLVSKWRRAVTRPDVPSCRRLAVAWRRPILEVLVMCGHLAPEEVDLPELPPSALPPALERLVRMAAAPDRDPELVRVAELLADGIVRAHEERAGRG